MQLCKVQIYQDYSTGNAEHPKYTSPLQKPTLYCLPSCARHPVSKIRSSEPGFFNTVPPAHLELLSAAIKEALTNTARYSLATRVQVKIDANEKFTRLYVKDNGIGCANIEEGLGLSGMKERARNLGGSLSIHATDGFLIVCVIPRQEGGETIEAAHRG